MVKPIRPKWVGDTLHVRDKYLCKPVYNRLGTSKTTWNISPDANIPALVYEKKTFLIVDEYRQVKMRYWLYEIENEDELLEHNIVVQNAPIELLILEVEGII